MEYSEEPRLIFSPLSQKDYSLFYSIEMDSYTEDVQFYHSLINSSDRVLELGCGNGRLTRLLSKNCQAITGIDISQEMIDLAKQDTRLNITFVCSDMTAFDFPCFFDTIVIPYNTLNLLGNKHNVKKCLSLCKKYMRKDGKLLLHLYHPNQEILRSVEKIFQFEILDQDNGPKIIKETLKNYCTKKELLTLEERYRVRPGQTVKENRDLKHILKLYSPLLPHWKKIFEDTELSLINCWGSYSLSPFCESTDTTLLIHATSG